MITSDHFWLILGLVSFIVVIFSLLNAHRNIDSDRNFRLTELFTNEDGRISGPRARMTLTFLVMTWAFIYLVLKDKLTEWYVIAYAGPFVVDRISSRYISTGQTSASTTKQSTVEGKEDELVQE